MTPAETWHDALRRAQRLDPDRIATALAQQADTGLRATSYDHNGGRTTRTPCENPETCDDGPEPHSHLVHSDPTGNAATNRRNRDQALSDMRTLQHATQRFVTQAAVVLEYVAGHRPSTWAGVIRANAELMPGTVQAGLDVDDERILPHAIGDVASAVQLVEQIARDTLPREPNEWERSWTSGLADEECCRLCIQHVDLRVEQKAKRLCQMHLRLYNEAGEVDPPQWLTEECRRIGSPTGPAWKRARSQWLQAIGVRESA